MLNKIIAFSIKNKLIVGLFVLGLIGYGIYELKKLPVDAVPDITNNQVQVITIAPALGAPDVERLITFPIEQVNNNIPGLHEIRSFSRFGLSVVTIVFDDNVDIYWARQQVSERLAQVQEDIPKDFGRPFLAPVTSGLGEIYQYTIRPKKGYESKYDAMRLRTIQDWIVRRQLLGVDGVAEVSSFGGLLKQYEVAVVPEKLKSFQLSISDVYAALEKNNQNTGGAYIEKGPAILFIRSEGLVGSLEDIQNIVVKNLTNGTPLLVRDIAEVRFGQATRYGAMTFGDGQQVSGAVVLMLKGANGSQVIKNIKERIAQIEKTLPEGVAIDAYLDRSKMVDNAIGTVSKNLLEGALIVIFVLVIFLGNLRAGLLVASVIPLSMLFAIILMNTFGVSGNLMSLGALDFGLIVDGAVIIVEAVMFKLFHSKLFQNVNRLSQNEMDNQVQSSASTMMNSAVFGQVIILIVYLPIFTLQGIEGKMFKPMAQTVAFALLGAFILSLTYVPMMSSLVLSKNTQHKRNLSDKMMDFFERSYQKLLHHVLRRQKMAISAVLVLFCTAMFTLSRLGGEFIPSLPEGDFAVDVRVLPGSNLETSIAAVSQASKTLLAKFPDIEEIVSRTGSSEVPTDPMAVDASDMMVILKPRKEWTSAKTYDELEEKMRAALADIPGVSFGFTYPVAMRFNELISGARQDVVCKIFGENLDTLAHYAAQLGKISQNIDGSESVYVEPITGMPQITIKYKRALIAQYGLSIDDVNQLVNAAFAGRTTGTVYEGEKRFDLVVRLDGEKRKRLEDVQELLIATPQGTQIPLSHVASVAIEDGPNQIQRENSQRRIIVGFNVRGRDIQSVVSNLQQQVDKKLILPPGYYVTYGGAFENLEAAKSRLMMAVPLALLLIFILLYFTFRSVKQGLLIYTSIPLSAIGGIFALAIRDISFSVSAGIGFIALFGVAVLNGIVLVAEFNRLKKLGHTNILRVVITGAKTRLRPVLMTASVASLGFLPMALSHSEGAEVQRPLATVVIGGLAVATLLTLFVLPMLYLFFDNNKIKIKTKGTAIAILLVLFAALPTRAQQPISLAQAIDTAIAHNAALRNEQRKAEYQQKLIASTQEIAPTTLSFEYGQINSYHKDKGFGLSQSFNFPSVYQKQKKLMQANWKASLLQVSVQESELRKQVASLYFDLLDMQKRKELLTEIEGIYQNFYNKANFRFEKGESNIAEKATAANQLGQIRMQLKTLDNDLSMAQLQFRWMLNSSVNFQVVDEQIQVNVPKIQEQMLAALHPELELLKQEQIMAKASTATERAKLLPEINLAYNLNGIRGMADNNVYYDGTPRFHSIQIGLNIPLFASAQRAKISAAKLNQDIAQKAFDNNNQRFTLTAKSVISNYQNLDNALGFYEKEALKNAELLQSAANKQYQNGEINYLDWVMLINQVTQIKSDYLEALHKRNTALAEIIYYTNLKNLR
jgi:cobalt-zinc-cadmium resistance protein CzcA